MNSGFSTISNQACLDAFLERVDYLHDAMLRELVILSRGYVDERGFMFGDVEPYDARLIFQSQSPDSPCIELICEDVQKLAIAPRFPLDPSGSVAESGTVLYLAKGTCSDRYMVAAKAMRYRVHGRSLLGEEPRIGRRLDEDPT